MYYWTNVYCCIISRVSGLCMYYSLWNISKQLSRIRRKINSDGSFRNKPMHYTKQAYVRIWRRLRASIYKHIIRYAYYVFVWSPDVPELWANVFPINYVYAWQCTHILQIQLTTNHVQNYITSAVYNNEVMYYKP